MYEYNAEVLRVVDADTFDLLVDVGFSITLKERFRLNGIDAPETWRPTTQAEKEHGMAATAAVKELIEGKKVKVITYKEDKYARYLCDITTREGISLAGFLMVNNFVKRESY